MKKEKLNTIADALKKTGKSQKEIADHFGININTVSRWCVNSQQPTLSMFFKLSKYLGVPIWSLIKFDTPNISDEKSINEKVQEIDSAIKGLNEIRDFFTNQNPFTNE